MAIVWFSNLQELDLDPSDSFWTLEESIGKHINLQDVNFGQEFIETN